MVDRDVIAAKVAIVTRCLARISSVTRDNPSAIEDIDIADIVVLNLQRSIQACIDIMTHLLGELNLGIPPSTAEGLPG